MRAAIDVTDRAEADRLKAALDNQTMRVTANVLGELLKLEPEQRRIALAFATRLADSDGSLLGSSAIDLPDAINQGRA
jgi:hypothetical protein